MRNGAAPGAPFDVLHTDDVPLGAPSARCRVSRGVRIRDARGRHDEPADEPRKGRDLFPAEHVMRVLSTGARAPLPHDRPRRRRGLRHRAFSNFPRRPESWPDRRMKLPAVVNAQGMAGPKGRLLWASPALPGAVHDAGAARAHGIIDALTETGITCRPDRGDHGAGDSAHLPLPWPMGRPPGLPAGRQPVPREVRALAEQAIATLESRLTSPQAPPLDDRGHRPRPSGPRPPSGQLALRSRQPAAGIRSLRVNPKGSRTGRRDDDVADLSQ